MAVLLAFRARRSGRRSGLVLVLDLLAALTEVALAKFVADLIDLLKGMHNDGISLHRSRGLCCCGWRSSCFSHGPSIFVAYELTKNQVLSPPFQTRVRWQSHGYMLRQSLGFFQNDFAGRVANKLMQTAPAMRDSILQLSDAAVFVAVQWLSALALFGAADLRLVVPLMYVARGLSRNRGSASCPASANARPRPPRHAPCCWAASSTAIPTS